MEELYKTLLPGLASDPDYKITSPVTTDYNCIAWACVYSNCWMEPPDGKLLTFDGIHFSHSHWPDGVTPTLDPQSLIEVFEKKGYQKCDSWEHEEGYQKVALYYNPNTNQWTHASRELMQKPCVGKWTSKLGPQHDIQHGNPYTIEGEIYGKVLCIMKRKFK